MKNWNRDTLEANRGKLFITENRGIFSYVGNTRDRDLFNLRDADGINTNLTRLNGDWLIFWLNVHDAEVLPENDGGPLELTIQDRYILASDDVFGVLREVGRYLSEAMYKPAATAEDVKRMEEIAARLKYTLEATNG